MPSLLRDLRYAWRTLLRFPLFAAVAGLTLALGMGANSAIFSMVNGVLLRPLPYGDAERLVMISNRYPKIGLERAGVSGPDFVERRDQSRAFEQVAAHADASLNLTGRGDPVRLNARRVSANFFSTLGVAPARGRDFLPAEEKPGHAGVAIVSDALWKRRFGSDPELVGRSLTLNGESTTVVGILPPGFYLPQPDFDPSGFDLAVPLALTAAQVDPSQRGNEYMQLVARLEPGVTLEQAQADLDRLTRQALEQSPPAVREFFESNGWGAVAVPLKEFVTGDVRPALLVLLGAVGFVLLIACANVSNLLLSRAASRQKEIAIRSALGASRLHILRQLLTESTLLACLGGALGLLLALWGMDALVAAGPDHLPRLHEIHLDGRVLAWTGLLSVLVGILFGLAPALQASRLDLNEALKDGGPGASSARRRTGLRSALVVCQIALALILLAGAGLMIRSFLRLQKVDPGFQPRNVLSMVLSLPPEKYARPEQRSRFFLRLLERLRALPGVGAAGAGSLLPLAPGHDTASFAVEGRIPQPGEPSRLASVRLATPGYLGALGIPLAGGRDFSDRDGPGAPGVVIVDEKLARQCWPGQDPIGRRLTFSEEETGEGWLTVVGVAGQVKDSALEVAPRPHIYVPHAQMPLETMFVVVRFSTSDPRSHLPALRREIASLDAGLPVFAVRAMEEYIDRALARPRLRTVLLSVFAALALALATVGIYGVMAYSVTQRTQEIGIRMALGARGRDVLRMVVGQGLKLTLAGLAIGLGGALALTRALSSLLFGVSPTDPATFAWVSLFLGSVSLLACYLPARRASSLNPLQALRRE